MHARSVRSIYAGYVVDAINQKMSHISIENLLMIYYITEMRLGNNQ